MSMHGKSIESARSNNSNERLSPTGFRGKTDSALGINEKEFWSNVKDARSRSTMFIRRNLDPTNKTAQPERHIIPVSDAVMFGSKKMSQNENGVKGYEIPMWDKNLKPRAFRIAPGKNINVFEAEAKKKELVPGPNKYKFKDLIAKDMGNAIVCKSPRETQAAELQRIERKRKFPGVGQHKVSYTAIEIPTKGFSKVVEPRVGPLDDAQAKAQKIPDARLPELKHIRSRARVARIWPEHKEKVVQKTALGPTSYEVNDAFKNS